MKLYHYTLDTRSCEGVESKDIWKKIQDSGVLLTEMNTPIHNWRKDEYVCNDNSNVWFTSNPTEVPGGCLPFGSQIFEKKGIQVNSPKGVLTMDPFTHPEDFDYCVQHMVNNFKGRTNHVHKLKRFTFLADDINAISWRKHSTKYSAISSKRKAYVASNDTASIINGDKIEEQWVAKENVDINKAIEVDYIDYDPRVDFLKQRNYTTWSNWAVKTYNSLSRYSHIQKFMKKYQFKHSGLHTA
tara:strand:- start:371 stop:1096 length:726 start_codon:yes stop_codon:yes gene_type:complete